MHAKRAGAACLTRERIQGLQLGLEKRLQDSRSPSEADLGHGGGGRGRRGFRALMPRLGGEASLCRPRRPFAASGMLLTFKGPALEGRGRSAWLAFVSRRASARKDNWEPFCSAASPQELVPGAGWGGGRGGEGRVFRHAAPGALLRLETTGAWPRLSIHLGAWAGGCARAGWGQCVPCASLAQRLRCRSKWRLPLSRPSSRLVASPPPTGEPGREAQPPPAAADGRLFLPAAAAAKENVPELPAPALGQRTAGGPQRPALPSEGLASSRRGGLVPRRRRGGRARWAFAKPRRSPPPAVPPGQEPRQAPLCSATGPAGPSERFRRLCRPLPAAAGIAAPSPLGWPPACHAKAAECASQIIPAAVQLSCRPSVLGKGAQQLRSRLSAAGLAPFGSHSPAGAAGKPPPGTHSVLGGCIGQAPSFRRRPRTLAERSPALLAWTPHQRLAKTIGLLSSALPFRAL